MGTFYCYLKALNTGTLRWATAAALVYFYMVCHTLSRLTSAITCPE
jgi:hypothetical protein